jgi:hypothetical protein
MILRRVPLALLVIALVSCKQQDDPGNRRPKVAISILVDLSETWHNPESDALNQRVLTSVGNAIAGAANRLPRPIAVRFHAIGQASLGREPICATNYRPSAFAVGKVQPGTIRDRDEFTRYVSVDCPAMLLARPVEPSTEIVAAIITADRALELTRKGVPKVFVVLSDFKEESLTPYSFRGMSFKGSRFILVYRTLNEDRIDPAWQTAKLRDWDRRLKRLGAEVEVLDENAVLSSPKDFEALLRTSSL